MRLTVILNTYNHERYIAQAVDSVLMQETSFPFEVVVIDDCSEDGTSAILERYARHNPDRLRVVLLPDNRCDNRAFAQLYDQTQSDYVAVLDGDDYWTRPDKLERQVTFLDRHPDCTICFHNVTVVDEEGTPTAVFNVPDQRPFSTIEDLFEYTFIAGCSPVLRRAAVDRLPSWYGTAPVGDLPLYLLHAERGRIGYLDEVMGAYRVHGGGFWSGRSRRQQLELLVGLYGTLADRLPPDYRQPLLTHAAKWREQLTVERVRDENPRTRRRAGCPHVVGQAIRETLDATIPPRAPVSVVTQGDAALLDLGDRPAEHFTPGDPRDIGEALFARGDTGTAEAPWIAEGSAYDFRLYGESDRNRPLAEVTVVRGETAIEPHDCGHHPAGACVSASPNPLAGGPGVSPTTISWEARPGTGGEVHLAVRALDAYLPRTDTDAVRQVRRLADQGVRYVVLPAAARWWLEAFPTLRRYLERECAVVARAEACTVYALPERSSP
ncbi:glycosyltransferase [Geodermatophilus sp. SYSU D00697]